MAEPLKTFTGHTVFLWRVRVSPDGRWVASASGDGTVRVWSLDRAGGEVAKLEGHHIAAPGVLVGNSVCWSPDGLRLVTGSSTEVGKVRLFSAINWRAVPKEITIAGGGVFSVDVCPAGERVLVGCKDGRICVLKLSDGSVERELTGVHTSAVEAVAWSPSGRLFAFGERGRKACIWDATTWTKTKDLAESGVVRGGMRWSSDGTRVVVPNHGGKKVVVYDVTTGGVETTLETEGMTAAHDADWSPDGSMVSTASSDGTVRVWKASSGALLRSYTVPEGKHQYGICWRSGDFIVSGGVGCVVRVWRAGDLVQRELMRALADAKTQATREREAESAAKTEAMRERDAEREAKEEAMSREKKEKKLKEDAVAREKKEKKLKEAALAREADLRRQLDRATADGGEFRSATQLRERRADVAERRAKLESLQARDRLLTSAHAFAALERSHASLSTRCEELVRQLEESQDQVRALQSEVSRMKSSGSPARHALATAVTLSSPAGIGREGGLSVAGFRIDNVHTDPHHLATVLGTATSTSDPALVLSLAIAVPPGVDSLLRAHRLVQSARIKPCVFLQSFREPVQASLPPALLQRLSPAMRRGATTLCWMEHGVESLEDVTEPSDDDLHRVAVAVCMAKAHLQRHGVVQLDAGLAGVRRRADGSWMLGELGSAVLVGGAREVEEEVGDEEWEWLHSGALESTVADHSEAVTLCERSSLAPEVLNAMHLFRTSKEGTTPLPFSRQPVFEWGVTVGRAMNHGAHPLGDDYPPREEVVKEYDSTAVLHLLRGPASLRLLVCRALSFVPSDRPSIRELLDALQSVEEPREAGNKRGREEWVDEEEDGEPAARRRK
jgi:WD domain, G-beta repeat/Eukaryotic translation initiation factor eIF2A